MKTLTAFAFTLIVLATVFPCSSLLALDEDKTHWSSGDGSETEIWLLKRTDGSMELYGKDAASSFGGLVIEGEGEKTFICHGRGFRFVGGLSFTYRSTLTLGEADGKMTLTEKWEATLATGDTIKGETVLSPVTKEGAAGR